VKPLSDRIKMYANALNPRPTAEDALLTLVMALEAEDEQIMESMRTTAPERFAGLQAELKRLGEVRQIVDALAARVQGRPLPEPKLPPIKLPPAQ